tara:strand:- start:614 stop:1174 length:561 start_codon:yes stop_codon:yes gene_type:complete
MPTNKLKEWIKVKIPDDSLNEILKYVNGNDHKWNTGGLMVDGSKKEIRDCNVSVVKDEQINNYIFGNLIKANNSYWKFDLKSMIPTQFITYKTDQHYDWHDDWHVHEGDAARKLSMTLVLNDEYEGGEFQFKRVSYENDEGVEIKTLKLEKGDILIFPSIMTHRVLPVTSGVRKVFVAWACGPQWR